MTETSADERRLWSSFGKALGAELRETPSIRGASGLEHRLQALCVDDKTGRIILFSDEPNPTVAALIQGDVQPDYASCYVLRPLGRGDPLMFIAMNRFRVAKGSEAAFEQVWMSRDSHLEKVPGFVEFHLLKGPEAEDHTLYASHTIWENRATFEARTKSEAFRAAHSRAGDNKPLYLDHPQFEGFEVRQTVGRSKGGVA